MLQINVNGLSRPGPSGPENWGELLNFLEQGEGPARQVVTAVRFGGVAVPTFREPPALSRGLDALGDIEVETATVRELLRESAQAAYDSIAPLTSAINRIVDRIRAGNTRTTTRQIPELTASIQSLTTVTAMLSGSVEPAPSHRPDLDALIVRLCAIVDAIAERQVREDWPAVADVLAMDLAPTLAAWASVVRRVWAI
jgi:hypothetical protein